MTTQGLILYDFLKKTHVRKSLNFLKNSQSWPLEDLQKYQTEKLQKLLSEVARNVPYYRDLETLSPDDFESFPTLTRKDIMEAGDRLLSDNIQLKNCKVSRTGGTTGPPFRLYRDTETRSWALAAYYRFYDWMSVEPGMPEVELWGRTDIRNPKSELRTSKSANSWFNGVNRLYAFDAFSFNDDYLNGLVNRLIKIKPKLIRGYLSAILLLADYIKRNNIKGINPIAVSCTSETLFPEYRKKIEEVFQASLFNQYGCGECNSIAFECSEHNGMHISMEHCVLEQDDDNNLIITNLDNHSQPFIRYKNNDVGVISSEVCSCGNASPRLLELQGRSNENILLKTGASVNGIFFANLFEEAGFINNDKMLRFQVSQNRYGGINLKLEVKTELRTTDINKLYDSLTPFFDEILISQHEFLNSGPGGKFKYIISNF